MRQARPNDYIVDGILYCGKCKSPRQIRVTAMGQTNIIWQDCKCEEKEYQRQEARLKRLNDIANLRAQAQNVSVPNEITRYDCTFADADQTELLGHCRQYVESWDDINRKNMGLLLHGTPGGGKTYAAACIGNALISRGKTVMMASLPKIVNAGFDRNDAIRGFGRYDLLILDDLGVERQSSFAREAVYQAVNERYDAKKPIVVTTNLSLDEIQHPADLSLTRVYSRLMAMCVAVLAVPQPYREREHREKTAEARRLLAKPHERVRA